MKLLKLGLLHLITGDYKNAPVMLPNGLVYLATYLKHSINFDNIIIETDVNKLLSQNLDIIGISSYTQTFTEAIEISKKIKQVKNIPIIIGGNHISSLPKSLAQTMDIGVIGEGEETLKELILLFLENNVNKETLSNIDGIVFHDKDRKIITKTRKFIENIDKIPLPDRTLLNNLNLKLDHGIFTSRGCPFKCSFCTAGNLQDKVRYHSVERIIKEINEIIKIAPNQKHIAIADDLFAFSKTRLEEIAKAIKQEGINKKVFFSCNVRASCFDDEICKLLSEINVKIVALGLESNDEKVLKYLKGSATPEQNQKAVDICAKNNLTFLTHFIIGSEIETPENMAKTYWFMRKNFEKISKMDVFIATPYPSTPFWYSALENNLIDENFKDWHLMDLKFKANKSILLSKYHTHNEFEYAQKEFSNLCEKKSSLETEFSKNINKENYYRNLYTNLAKKILIKNANVLEISNYKKSLVEYSDKDINLTKVFSKKQKYDYIFLIHSLETIKDYKNFLSELKNSLTDSGNIILVIENIQNPNYIFELLTNRIIRKNIELFDNSKINNITLKNILELLMALNLKPIELIKNPYMQYLEDIKNNENTWNLLFKHIKLKEQIDFNIFSYTITAKNL